MLISECLIFVACLCSSVGWEELKRRWMSGCGEDGASSRSCGTYLIRHLGISFKPASACNLLCSWALCKRHAEQIHWETQSMVVVWWEIHPEWWRRRQWSHIHGQALVQPRILQCHLRRHRQAEMDNWPSEMAGRPCPSLSVLTACCQLLHCFHCVTTGDYSENTHTMGWLQKRFYMLVALWHSRNYLDHCFGEKSNFLSYF